MPFAIRQTTWMGRLDSQGAGYWWACFLPRVLLTGHGDPKTDFPWDPQVPIPWSQLLLFPTILAMLTSETPQKANFCHVCLLHMESILTQPSVHTGITHGNLYQVQPGRAIDPSSSVTSLSPFSNALVGRKHWSSPPLSLLLSVLTKRKQTKRIVFGANECFHLEAIFSLKKLLILLSYTVL